MKLSSAQITAVANKVIREVEKRTTKVISSEEQQLIDDFFKKREAIREKYRVLHVEQDELAHAFMKKFKMRSDYHISDEQAFKDWYTRSSIPRIKASEVKDEITLGTIECKSVDVLVEGLIEKFSK